MKNLQILQVVLVFAGLLIVHTSAVSLNLVGTWTDDCSTCVGGSLYICVDDNGNFDGVYSEIGRVFGTIVENNATGIWFEAGFNDFNSGGFSWRLSNNGSSFEGEYWYNSDECVTFSWNAAKVSSEAQPDLCKSIANSRDVGGVWVRPTVTGSGGNDTLYVCVDRDSHYVSSLELADNSTSYFSWGRLQQSGRSSAGTWYTSADSSFIGIEMLFLRSSDQLDGFSWNLIHPNEAIPLRFNEVGLHGSSTWERIAEESPFCRLNSNLAPITSWEGVWTDSNFGKGRLYVCREENSTSLTGIFSEFGYIESEVNLDFDPNTNQTVENAAIGGTFYDGGGRSRDSGPFNLTLASDGYSFSGTFKINGLTGVGDWAENRLDVTNYFSDSCYNTWNVTTNVTITGSYVYGPGATDILDICFIKNPESTTRPYTGPTGSIIASYEFANGQKGYMVGYYSDDGKSMQVHQYTKGQVRTVAIGRLTDDATLTLFHWDVDNDDEMIYRICGDTTSPGGGDLTQRNDLYWNGHFIEPLPRVVRSNTNSTSFAIPSISKCQRNQKLFFIPVTQSVVADSPSSTSAAGSAVYSVSFVSFVLATLSSFLIAMLM